MNYQGWVKVWRQMEDWEWYTTPNMAHLFQHLILKANHEDNRWQGQVIKRGQLITSLDSLKKQTGISIQSIRTCLNRLKETGEITEKSTNRFRLITINNYNTYQDQQQATNNQVTNKQQTSNKQLTTNKNDKNTKNVKNEKKWTPPTLEEVIEYVNSNQLNVNCKKFIGHYENAEPPWTYYDGRGKLKPVRNWKQKLRTVWHDESKPKPKCTRSGCKTLPTHTEYDDTGMKCWYCEEHKPRYKPLGLVNPLKSVPSLEQESVSDRVNIQLNKLAER